MRRRLRIGRVAPLGRGLWPRCPRSDPRTSHHPGESALLLRKNAECGLGISRSREVTPVHLDPFPQGVYVLRPDVVATTHLAEDLASYDVIHGLADVSASLDDYG